MVFSRQSGRKSIVPILRRQKLLGLLVFSAIFQLYGQDLPKSAVVLKGISESDDRNRVWILLDQKIGSTALENDHFQIPARTQRRRQNRSIETVGQRSVIDQAVSLNYIQRIKSTGVKIRRVSRWINAVSVNATDEQLELVRDLPFVRGIQMVRRFKRSALKPKREITLKSLPFLETMDADYGLSEKQLAMLNVPEVHALGYTGKNVTVLMLDTGFMTNHTAIKRSRIRAEHDFINDDNQTQNENDHEEAINQDEHGTMTYSVLGGYAPGNLFGPAYECDFLLAKTEMMDFEIVLEEDNFVAALEWGELLGADIVSSSIGYNEWYEYEQMDGQTAITTRAVQQAVRLGMVVVVAAGNERGRGGKPGWGGYILAPADADSIITVGAVDSKGAIANFSSIGPTADGRIKPEVVALGVGLYTASPHGPDSYTSGSGTSFAAPLVAGCAALLLQAHPFWSAGDIRAALMNTASQSNQPDNFIGYGLIDVLAALRYNPDDSSSTGGKPTVNDAGATIGLYPNPWYLNRSRSTQITWTLVARTTVRIDVFNLLGEHLINLYHHNLQEPEIGSVAWDGVDSDGRKVASGIYLVRLRTGQETIVARLSVQR